MNSHPPSPAATPADPPPAADMVISCDDGGWHVHQRMSDGRELWVGSGVSKAQAELLCSGPRLAALEAALQRMVAAVEASWEDCVEVQGGLSGLELRLATVDARAALGAAGPGGAT